MKHLSTLCLLITLLVNIAFAQTAPKPYGVLPAERQLKWHETEMYSLIHFTPTTFENKEWGYGDADPTIFNPTDFDADQIINAAKDGGMRGIILVAKHHDGFCLWPTKTTEYNISKSPWRNGKGDMVREFEQACRKAEMKFGIYCSPWDRNNAAYGTPDYLPIYREQLRELYTNYGDIFMSWHDGANGGDGYYGGTNEARKIDNTTYYDWNNTWNGITRKLQPNATIFSDIGPDVRWVGNEKGFAAETHWATFTPKPLTGATAVPGNVNTETSSIGTQNGTYWIPAECDVPLRPGWFYHPEQDGKEKDANYLVDLYFKSVGRGACLDLGLSPTPEGKLHENDVRILKEFKEKITYTFSKNLTQKATISAGNSRNGFPVKNLTDNNRYSYWATNDNITATEIIVDFTKVTSFNIIQLRENIKLGQRINQVNVAAWIDNKWQPVAEVGSVGANRLIKLEKPIDSSKVKISLVAPVSITLSELSIY
jgi:alpha-L-fucosidase